MTVLPVAKALVRPGICPGWNEHLLLADVICTKFLSTGSYIYILSSFGLTSDNFRYIFFIIYKVMKYRKILIKYNAYFKKAVFHSRENIKGCIFTAVKICENISCISRVKLDILCFLH